MLRRSHTFSAALIVAGLSIATPACATQTYGYRGPNRGYSREIERRAYDFGYRDGLRAGERDGRGGRSFSFSRHDDWRDADQGYNRGYGDRDWYRRTYRSGFESGYTDAYNRSGSYGRYPRTSSNYPAYPNAPERAVLRSPAAQTGYRDGFEAGRDDANSRRAFDPQRSRRYRDGDHDYNNRYGSRDEYKRDYRAAFQQGYNEGFRGGRR
jgi:hypothetical protein